MSRFHLSYFATFTLITVTYLSACTPANVAPPGAPVGKPIVGAQPATPGQPAPGQPVPGQPAPGQPAQQSSTQPPGPIPISGDWQFGYQLNNGIRHASVHIDQQGENFAGKGVDEETKIPFDIEQGNLKSGNVTFIKQYAGKISPIQYTGSLEWANDKDIHGPYMHGDYSVPGPGGKIVSNIWEAALAPAPGSQASTPAPGQEAPTQTPSADSDDGMALSKTPELSGKWNVAYEYNFRTIHSTMFLEENGDQVTGHGYDAETHEKFIIDHGTYRFPHLTLVRRWLGTAGEAQPTKPKGKGKAKAHNVESSAGRTMVFRADVSVVHTKDYSGPALTGKTQGGGAWKARMYK